MTLQRWPVAWYPERRAAQLSVHGRKHRPADMVDNSRLASGCGPLLRRLAACMQRRGKAPAGRLPGPVTGVGRCAPDPLRCSDPGTVAELASFASLSALKQSSTSQSTKRAARASPGPALLGAYTGPDSRPPGALWGIEGLPTGGLLRALAGLCRVEV